MSENGTPPCGLKASSLSVGWSGRVIAEKLDVSIEGGAITAIAGPNGAGKSTLLKTLVRQLQPLSGQVSLGGKDIWLINSRRFAQQIAYVPQSMEPAQDLTVIELVMLGRSPHQPWWSWSASAEDLTCVGEALEKTETSHLRDKHLSTLSGGERQRAAIATALAQKPQFMVLDEPTAHLDFRHQLELADLLKDLRDQGLGIVVVLHDLNLMSRLSDHVLLLNKPDGQPSTFVACGSPEAVLEPATLRAVYDVEVSVVQDPLSGHRIYAPTSCLPRTG